MFFSLFAMGFLFYFKDSIYLELLFNKITLDNNDMSAQDRLNKISYINDLVFNGMINSFNSLIFGFGSGSVKNYLGFGLLNTYATMFIEHGILVFFIILLFIRQIFSLIKVNIYLCLSIIMLLSHLLVIPDFYYLFTAPIIVYFFHV
ncbi:hypothetical protein [Photobacterium kishitanii]|uniref:hypothetical protein n=1 Tax=Photobacterium kishitanii TaxID=318456 RepID=UPI002739836B|nr:hypothetical protein [Photobacterium kishitanii]